MGISHESLGQIRDILRKLDRSIESVREERLRENTHAHVNARSADSATPSADSESASDACSADYGRRTG